MFGLFTSGSFPSRLETRTPRDPVTTEGGTERGRPPINHQINRHHESQCEVFIDCATCVLTERSFR